MCNCAAKLVLMHVYHNTNYPRVFPGCTDGVAQWIKSQLLLLPRHKIVLASAREDQAVSPLMQW